VYASGELQDWAEPKEEEAPWDQAQTKPSGNYGAADTNNVKLDPLPDVTQLIASKQNRPPVQQYDTWDDYPAHSTATGDGNPFTVGNDNYQGPQGGANYQQYR